MGIEPLLQKSLRGPRGCVQEGPGPSGTVGSCLRRPPLSCSPCWGLSRLLPLTGEPFESTQDWLRILWSPVQS